MASILSTDEEYNFRCVEIINRILQQCMLHKLNWKKADIVGLYTCNMGEWDVAVYKDRSESRMVQLEKRSVADSRICIDINKLPGIEIVNRFDKILFFIDVYINTEGKLAKIEVIDQFLSDASNLNC